TGCSAASATTVTRSESTDTNPPVTTMETGAPLEGVTRTVPSLSSARSGVCPARMPTSPSCAGATTLRASPDHTCRSAATMSTVSSATGTPTLISRPGQRTASDAVLLLDPGPVALEVLEATDVEERLLGHVVELAVSDLLERLDRLRERDRRAGHVR